MTSEVRLPKRIVARLENMPESGMGYQVVNLRLKNGRVLKNVTVLNSSIALLETDINVSEVVDVEISRKSDRK